jgi:adenylate kinase
MKLKEISMGNIIRERIKKDKKLEILVKKKMNAGKLLPDKVMNEIAKKYFKQNKIKDNFIFDGYPRTLLEAKYITKLFDFDHIIELNITNKEVVNRIKKRLICGEFSYIIGKKYKIISKKVKELRKKKGLNSKEIIIKVNSLCPKTGKILEKRKDDMPLKLKTRLNEYNKKTKPILKFFKIYAKMIENNNKIKKNEKKIPKINIINGMGSINKIQKKVYDLIKNG